MGLHDWMVAAMRDRAAGKTGIDVDCIERSEENIGATIMGRNMFGPQRGPWQDESWRGRWGENPPYHHDVFVHIHHLRTSLTMEGGTTPTSPRSLSRRSSRGPSRRRRAGTYASEAVRPSCSSTCARG